MSEVSTMKARGPRGARAILAHDEITNPGAPLDARLLTSFFPSLVRTWCESRPPYMLHVTKVNEASLCFD
jgi:hypothetical protein